MLNLLHTVPLFIEDILIPPYVMFHSFASFYYVCFQQVTDIHLLNLKHDVLPAGTWSSFSLIIYCTAVGTTVAYTTIKKEQL